MTTAQTGPGPKAAKGKAGALHRDLGLLDATMLVMGAMIGSGISVIPRSGCGEVAPYRRASLIPSQRPGATGAPNRPVLAGDSA